MNKSGRAGARGEVAVQNCLQATFPLVERRAKQGAKDRGDIGGVCPHVVIEVKHCPKRYEIAEWLKEADREGVNDSAELTAVWFKIRGKADPLDWPVMMRGRFFIKLLTMWADAYVPKSPPSDGSEQLSLF
jgi:hypothetical protein